MSGEPFDLTIAGGDDKVTVSKKGEGTFGHLPGSTGFEMIPRSIRAVEGSSAGGQFLNSRPTSRAFLLKLAVIGNWDDRRTAIDRLREILTSDDCRLIVERSDATWELGVVYESGLEGDFSRDSTTGRYALRDIAMTAYEPYWEAQAASVVELPVADETVSFLDNFGALILRESTAIGDFVVNNTGDAETPVSWVFQGPAEVVTVSLNDRGFTIPDGIEEGETITVDTQTSGMPAVIDQDGNSAYSRLGGGPVFPKLPRGSSTIHLAMSGAIAGTREANESEVLATNVVTNPALRSSDDGYSFDDESAWSWTAGDPGTLFTSVDDAVVHSAWWELTVPDGASSVAFSVQAVVGGLIVQILDGDGNMLLAVHAEMVMGQSGVQIDLPEGAATLKAGVEGTTVTGATRWLVSWDTTPRTFFDGNSDFAEWTGDVDDSTSILHASELVGGTVARVSYKTRKEVMH